MKQILHVILESDTCLIPNVPYSEPFHLKS